MYDEVPDYDYGSCQVQTAEPNKVGGGQLVERVASAVAGTRRTKSPVRQKKMTGWRESADCRPIRVIGWRDKRRV
jgi:hypothetical protein